MKHLIYNVIYLHINKYTNMTTNLIHAVTFSYVQRCMLIQQQDCDLICTDDNIGSNIYDDERIIMTATTSEVIDDIVIPMLFLYDLQAQQLMQVMENCPNLRVRMTYFNMQEPHSGKYWKTVYREHQSEKPLKRD